MSFRQLLAGLVLAMACGCSGDAGASASSARLSHHTASAASLPAPLQFEANRNFVTEYEDFQRLVNEEHVEAAAIRTALGVEATKQFTYTTVDGSEVCGWEFVLEGPKPDAPFYEAFAAGYPGQSFFVFFKKSWFQWHAVDCGFHETGVFGQTASEP